MKLHYINHLNEWCVLTYRLTRRDLMWMRWLIQVDEMAWVEA